MRNNLWARALLLLPAGLFGCVGDAPVSGGPASDAGMDAPMDSTHGTEDAGGPAGSEAGSDAANDAGSDAANDAGSDSSTAAPGAPSGVAAAAVPVVTTVSTLAGSGAASSLDGAGGAATFSDPRGLAIDSAGTLYVANSNRIRKVTPAGAVTTFAGSATSGFLDGTGTAATFGSVMGLAVEPQGPRPVAKLLCIHDAVQKSSSMCSRKLRSGSSGLLSSRQSSWRSSRMGSASPSK